MIDIQLWLETTIKDKLLLEHQTETPFIVLDINIVNVCKRNKSNNNINKVNILVSLKILYVSSNKEIIHHIKT